MPFPGLWYTEQLFTSAEPIKLPCSGTSGHDYTSRDGLGNHRSQHQTWTMNYDISTAPQVLVAVENCPWAELQDPAPSHRNIRLGPLWHESLSMRLVGEARRYVFQKLGRQVYWVVRRSTDRPEISQKMIQSEPIMKTLSEQLQKTSSLPLRSPTKQTLCCYLLDCSCRINAICSNHSSEALEANARQNGYSRKTTVFYWEEDEVQSPNQD